MSEQNWSWENLKTAVMVQWLERLVAEFGVEDYERVAEHPRMDDVVGNKNKVYRRLNPQKHDMYQRRWGDKIYINLPKKQKQAHDREFKAMWEPLDIHERNFIYVLEQIDNGAHLFLTFNVLFSISDQTKEFIFYISDMYEEEATFRVDSYSISSRAT